MLFVDKTAVPQPGEVNETGTNTATPNGQAQTSVNTGLITLEVPAKASQLIASIAPNRLYLTLLPPNYAPGAASAARALRRRTPRRGSGSAHPVRADRHPEPALKHPSAPISRTHSKSTLDFGNGQP